MGNFGNINKTIESEQNKKEMITPIIDAEKLQISIRDYKVNLEQISIQNKIFETNKIYLKESKEFCKNKCDEKHLCLGCRLKYIIINLQDLMEL